MYFSTWKRRLSTRAIRTSPERCAIATLRAGLHIGRKSEMSSPTAHARDGVYCWRRRTGALREAWQRLRMSNEREAVSLAENLTRLRITDGQTIEQVSAATRLPATIIAGLESGRISMSHKAVRALAKHFGVSVETLEG